METPALPLVRLTAAVDYEISTGNEYILLLNFVPVTGFNNTVTVTYLSNAGYHVIDLPHDLRASTIINQMGQLEKVDMPIQAILRKAHIVLGMSDAEGGIVTLDNSYL
jgi:hypothetical protein